MIDGNLANENKSFWEAKVSSSSKIEIFRKLREQLINVRFQEKVYEYVVSDHCTMSELIVEIVV